MGIKDYARYECPIDQEEAALLVDVETESMPETDEDGNLQYYCVEGKHIFVVDDDKALI